MTATPADPAPDVAEQLAALRAEAAQLELDELDDPMRAASDVAGWHARADQRRRRGVEIENELRDLEEWGALVLTHGDDVSRYTRVARPIATAYAHVIRFRVYKDDVRVTHRKPRDDVHAWLGAVQKLARAVPDDDNTRRVVSRELEAWFRFRDAITDAERCHLSGGGPFPAPELSPDGLPPWVRWGIHRLDGADRG
ncbi:hypothetical protein [Actinomycetospora flava]|uniref:DUF222 domain-containing protein n=1 Tax=Actinomycetospora flava TaxID=3129232 RepID=A0ABU8LZJ2_9PSEU